MRRPISPELPTTSLWLLPFGFILHDGEELMTMREWIAGHREELHAIASSSPMARRLVDAVPSSQTEIAVTIGFELAVLVLVTSLAVRRPDSRFRRYVYPALLGVFVLHAVTHALQVIVFGGYVPGVISAVSVIPVVGVAVYRNLFNSGALTLRRALATTAVGTVAFLPLFAALVSVARRIDQLFL